ncbi:Peptide transporter family protein [Rhynchospora pubera]|uniref:Peptide transporter family protein n=1 Tax=Rhynchospora pubera TaxID=906938 RepID=A0AAV8HPP4_9POAL|nr:Peptide transporter family protein [Rhynchospora pubera]
MDDYLDDPELWKAIESAALSSRHRKTLPPPSPATRFPPHCLSPSPSPSPSHQFAYRNPCRPRPKPQPDEVWQPEKKPRVSVQESMDRRIVVAQNQIATNVMPRQVKPDLNPIAFQSPVKSRVVVSEVSPVVESPSPVMEGKLGSRHSLLIGEFPSVASFKHYQDMALEILDKSDYSMISGNPYIKKSGWRKMSFFFNISYEIRDKSIEFDDSRNVRRAEFVVRAHMQGGRFSDGWGSCEKSEKRFNKPNHDIPSTAETRAKNKACQDLLGIGHGGKR